MKYYLAGPMSGIPSFNYPAFFAAAAHLRRLGLEVVSPAEFDDEQTTAAILASPDGDASNLTHTGGRTYGQFLARAVSAVADDDVCAVVFLPGWRSSRGARLEAFTALTLGRHFFYEYRTDGRPVLLPAAFVRDALL
jgi:hypothetical protein